MGTSVNPSNPNQRIYLAVSLKPWAPFQDILPDQEVQDLIKEIIRVEIKLKTYISASSIYIKITGAKLDSTATATHAIQTMLSQ